MLSYVIIADCAGVRESSKRVEKTIEAKGWQIPNPIAWFVRHGPIIIKLAELAGKFYLRGHLLK